MASEHLASGPAISSPDFRIGDVEAWVVDDGGWDYSLDFVFPDVPDPVREGALEGRLTANHELHLTYDCLLLRSPGHNVLVDAGTGGAGAGLLAGLERAGVGPSDIDTVVVTHAHPDHIGGLVDAGEVVFPAARHVMTRTEWAWWTSDEHLATVPDFLSGPARATLPVLERAGVVDLVPDESDIAPGILLTVATGHTPGHAVIEVGTGADRAVFLADAVVDELHFRYPEWTCAVDMLPDETVATRRRLLDAAAADDALVLAYHVAGIGHLERDGTAFRFVR